MKKNSKKARIIKKSIPLYLMVLPAAILTVMFKYIPLYGLKMSFQRFIPAFGLFGEQEWVGLYWFKYLFKYPDFFRAIKNTLIISSSKIVALMVTALFFSILINEVTNTKIKRTVQTLVYVPHFFSWVILSIVFLEMLSPSTGMVNRLLEILGFDPIFFLGDNRYFRATLIVTETWKEFGFATITYLAAMAGIDQHMYEAAVIDGANRFQRIIHITMRALLPFIALNLLMKLSGIMRDNFDQIYNLYSPVVWETGDVLDTMVHRIGMVQANFSLSSAVSVFESVVGAMLSSISYFLAYKFANYKIF